MTYSERLLVGFRELSGLVLSHETVRSTLDTVSDLAVQTIPACDVASTSLLHAGEISTVGSSDDIAVELDVIQYKTGQGPCLDAIGKDAMWFQIDEMTSDTKWPDFASQAAKLGFESLLAFTLKLDADTLGALNLYARGSHVFAGEDRENGAIYAAHAAVALANAQAWADGLRSRDEMSERLVTREVIERAVGILMEGEFRTSQESLRVLEERAEALNIKIRDSAVRVIESADRRRVELQLPEGFSDRTMGRIRK
jgi:transcriptional regulator with GAF, ATPase, and Fis domain